MVFVLMFSRCTRNYPPKLTQPLANVSSIELLDTSQYSIYSTELFDIPDNSDIILYKVPSEDFNSFWQQFVLIEFAKVSNDPSTDFGSLSVKITYNDGSIDIIGASINFSRSATGNRIKTGWYCIRNYNDYLELFSQYVDDNLLPQTRHG